MRLRVSVTGTSRVGTTWLVLAVASTAAACRDTRPRSADATARPDSAYAAMQSRGKMVMGVNQYTSAHVFEDLPDGGRVVLDRDTSADTVEHDSPAVWEGDRKSTRLNSSHSQNSYAVFCLKKK